MLAIQAVALWHAGLKGDLHLGIGRIVERCPGTG
jgi:hypothetical protein